MSAVSGFYYDGRNNRQDGGAFVNPFDINPHHPTRQFGRISFNGPEEISNQAARRVAEEAPQRFRDIAALYEPKLVQTKLTQQFAGSFVDKFRIANELRDESIEYTSQELRKILHKLKGQNPLLNSLNEEHFIGVHERAALCAAELMFINKEPDKHLRKDGSRHIIAHPLDVVLLAVETEGVSCSVEDLYEIMLVAEFHDSLEDCEYGHGHAYDRLESFLRAERLDPKLRDSVLAQVITLTITSNVNGHVLRAEVESTHKDFDPVPWLRKIGGYEVLLNGTHPDEEIHHKSLRRKGIDCLVNSLDQMERIRLAQHVGGQDAYIRKMLATAQAYEYLFLGLLHQGPEVMGEVYQIAQDGLEMNRSLLHAHSEDLPLDIQIKERFGSSYAEWNSSDMSM